MNIQTLSKRKTNQIKSKEHAPKTLADMKLNVSKRESNLKLYNNAVNWMKRYIVERKYTCTTLAEAKKAAKDVTFGKIKMRIQLIENMNEKDKDYYSRLLRTFEKEGNKYFLDGFVRTKIPVKITLTEGNEKKIGYSVLNGEMKNHEESWSLKNEGYDYSTIWDYKRLLAKVWLDNLLLDHLQKNMEWHQKNVVKEMLGFGLNTHKLMPTDLSFRKDFLKIAMTITDKGTKWSINEGLNRFKDEFYLESKMGMTLRSRTIRDFLEKNELVNYIKKEKRKKGTAKVYETNQNISATTREVMKNNLFLTHYGFVELHNSVDLKTFALLEKQFEELTKKISIPVCKDYSFRIKKLGNHNAGGIYYRHAKTVIIDVNHPQTYVHELGHQINIVLKGDEEKMASTSKAFKPIKERYKRIVTELVNLLPKKHYFSIKWNKNRGYNKDYYFDDEEIFARCFEMYVDELSIKNALAKSDLEEYIYPKNEEFRSEIINYFNNLLEK